MLEMEVHGFKELYEKLEQLPERLAAKVLAKAARKAFKPVLADARGMVPQDTGALRDALRITVRKGRGNEPIRVGLRIGAAKGGNADAALPPARRWHFVELGTATQAPHPFLRPALDRNKQAIVETLKTEIAKHLAKVAKLGRISGLEAGSVKL
jgi:HK97 gp10 family phage protein